MYPGLAQELCRTSSTFRELVNSYQSICDKLSLLYFVEVISGQRSQCEAQNILQEQLALVCLELALADLLRVWGAKPTLLLGHRLGEYVALCVSGVLSITDTLYLVGKRASLLQGMCPAETHAMLAANYSSGDLLHAINTEQLLSCEMSCKSAPKQTVASGTCSDIECLQACLQSSGRRSRLLPIAYGFDSAQLEPMLDRFEVSARCVPFASPKIVVVSSLTATVADRHGHFTASYLVRQARNTVDFLGALETTKEKGLINENTVWFEIGLEPLCPGFIHSTFGLPTKDCPHGEERRGDWETMSAYLSSPSLYLLPFRLSHLNLIFMS